jgi:hypothetical protein
MPVAALGLDLTGFQPPSVAGIRKDAASRQREVRPHGLPTHKAGEPSSRTAQLWQDVPVTGTVTSSPLDQLINHMEPLSPLFWP